MMDLPQQQIEITNKAAEQIALIQEHDYTLSDQIFRLKIDGKGCGGFDYALGFSTPHADDIIITKTMGELTINVNIDPFTAYYCSDGKIDYLQNMETMEEGFVFFNNNEKNYKGKFFKDESKVPQLKK